MDSISDEPVNLENFKEALTNDGEWVKITQEEIDDKKSYGILGMKERALVFGGKLEIKSVEGQGTTIKVEIPAND